MMKIFLFSLTFILAANVSTFGCWCRTSGAVLDEFEKSEQVLVARLISTDASKAIMLVERSYKGKSKPGDQLTFEQGQFGDCVIGFEADKVGDRYLFYLNKSAQLTRGTETIYSASLCSRNNKLARAFDDMAYLDKLPVTKGRTRLSGFIGTKYDEDSQNFAGMMIRVKGKQNSYSVTTDANGFFEIYDLPAGDYVIDPEVPSGWRIDYQYMFGIAKPSLSNRYQISVKANRHTTTKISVVTK